MRTIQIVNRSSCVASAQLVRGIAGVQLQLDRHLSSHWGVSATLVDVAKLDPASESIVILDDTTQADALGYHALAAHSLIPVGFVFAGTAKNEGVTWTEVLSHEVCEQAVDPFCNTAVIASWGGKPAALALEVADPVEASTYTIIGVVVSNFVLPSWFDAALPSPAGWDLRRNLKAACEVEAGGYAQYTLNNMTWQQVLSSVGHKRNYRGSLAYAAYSRHARRARRVTQQTP